MEEPVFITYANSNLTENPEVFFQLCEYFKNINEQFPKLVEEWEYHAIELVIKYFAQFVRADGIKSARKILKEESLKIIKESDEFDNTPKEESKERLKDWRLYSLETDPEVRIAFEAVYGNRDDYCESGPCPKFINRIFAFDRELLRGGNRLKCYECDQMSFRRIMEDLCKGVEFSRIPERFENNKYYVASFDPGGEKRIKPGTIRDGKLIYWVRNLEQTLFKLIMAAPKTTMVRAPHCPPGEEESFQEFRRVFLPTNVFHFSQPAFENNQPKILGTFIGVIFKNAISAYSLAEFLIHNDRRKIKQCPYCEKFYIASINRKKCYSKKCEKEYRRLQKQKQRNDDPVTYC
jgi:hypothetical protein